MKKILTIILLFLTLFATAQCPTGETEVTIDVGTDNWGYEIYWELTPAGNAWFVDSVDIVENANEELESLDSFNPETTAIVDKRFSDQITEFTKDVSDSIWLDQDSYKPNHLTYILKNINTFTK